MPNSSLADGGKCRYSQSLRHYREKKVIARRRGDAEGRIRGSQGKLGDLRESDEQPHHTRGPLEEPYILREQYVFQLEAHLEKSVLAMTMNPSVLP